MTAVYLFRPSLYGMVAVFCEKSALLTNAIGFGSQIRLLQDLQAFLVCLHIDPHPISRRATAYQGQENNGFSRSTQTRTSDEEKPRLGGSEHRVRVNARRR
jgi:hypothetical protein